MKLAITKTEGVFSCAEVALEDVAAAEAAGARVVDVQPEVGAELIETLQGYASSEALNDLKYMAFIT